MSYLALVFISHDAHCALHYFCVNAAYIAANRNTGEQPFSSSKSVPGLFTCRTYDFPSHPKDGTPMLKGPYVLHTVGTNLSQPCDRSIPRLLNKFPDPVALRWVELGFIFFPSHFLKNKSVDTADPRGNARQGFPQGSIGILLTTNRCSQVRVFQHGNATTETGKY